MTRNGLLVVLLILSQYVFSQTLSRTDITEVKLRNSGPITRGSQVTGYYNFYNVEKKDRKNNNYLLALTDENLKEINSKEIVRPNTYLLIEACFNGDAFGFLFYDAREKKLELLSYDKSLNETGKMPVKLENRYAAMQYQYIAQGNPATQAFLLAVPNKGFLYYGLKEGSKSDYEIVFYDNTMKEKWRAEGPDDKYDFENAGEAFQTEDYVGSAIMRRTSIMSTNIEMDLLVLDVNSGKQVFRVPLETSKYKISLTEVFHEKGSGRFVVYGEYFNKDQNVIKDQSLGFITVVLDAQGKIISEKINDWKADIAKHVSGKDKESFGQTSILFHEFIRTADGHTFAIGEQYKKGGAPMAAKINIQNLVIFEFDRDFSISKVHVFEKSKSSIGLPGGMLVFSSKLMSFIAKSMGGFDYIFTQMSPDNSVFSVHYINYDRELGDKAQNVLGSVIYTPEKTFAVDKLPLNRKSTAFYVYRGKPGYVLVNEYFAKEKRLDSRLEKLNY